MDCTHSIRGVLVERFTGRPRLVGEECKVFVFLVARHNSALVGR